MTAKLDSEIIFQKAKKLGVLFDKAKINGVNSKCPAKCLVCGYKWKPFISSIYYSQNGHHRGCPRCAKNRVRGIIYSNSEIQNIVKTNLGDFFEYTGTIKSNPRRYEIRCLKCGKKTFKKVLSIKRKVGCRCKSGTENPHYKGVGEMSGDLFGSIKRSCNARRKKVENCLSVFQKLIVGNFS